jgi:hypothetical protein
MAARINLNLPSSLWTAKDSARLAQNTLAAIKLRTSQGIDADGRKFSSYAPYSTRPIYIPLRGARLKPKGGRKSRTGRTVFYAGGYDQYKRESRKHGTGSSALVDLTLSGALMQNLVVLDATASRFVIGLAAHVRHYGYDVNAEREFLGLSPQDVNVLVSAVQAELTKKIRGRTR